MRWFVLTSIALAVEMCVVALVIVIRPARRTSAPITTVTEEELFGSDAAELEKAFAAVEAETLASRRRLVRIRLESLRSDRVPLRRIATSPGPGVARLGFANGTVLLARASRAGDVANVIRLHHRGGLIVVGYADHDAGVVVAMEATVGRGRCELVVIGLDQAD